ncbi:GyrI-like domain-containing protein [Clostridium sporogenes]|uniref:GyrI-like domain-containing protein n=1 Tax=Clostridium sporogenes TaxID=1509 RepID=UPI000AE77798|nr:GyrI-like domain-containing protein [Clostridium sporogenes]
MASLNVEIVELKEKVVYGLWKQSNDKTISNDIDTLSEEYYNTICSTKEMVLPYIVLSRNYDETSKDFEMFIGSTIENNGLKSFTLPAGKYAKVTIKPKLGLFGVLLLEKQSGIST